VLKDLVLLEIVIVRCVIQKAGGAGFKGGNMKKNDSVCTACGDRIWVEPKINNPPEWSRKQTETYETRHRIWMSWALIGVLALLAFGCIYRANDENRWFIAGILSLVSVRLGQIINSIFSRTEPTIFQLGKALLIAKLQRLKPAGSDSPFGTPSEYDHRKPRPVFEETVLHQ
jgi:hypothetical protein